MPAARSWTREHEVLHWLLVLAAAIALTLLVAKVLGAFDALPEPGRLPDDMGALARPMPAESAQPFFPETPPGRQLPPAQAAAQLWMILDHHRAGRPLEAIDQWMQIELPEETAHWRQIALGQAYLKVADLEQAAAHLGAAQQLAPEHAVVLYFRGLLRLEQAVAAGRVPGNQHGGDLLVAFTPAEDRAAYRLAAIAEFDLALAQAKEVNLDQPLVAGDFQVAEDVRGPTAGDLLAALGADNFVGRTHHLLFGLRLDQGQLAAAERHLDLAAATGIAPGDGYRGLGEAHLLAGNTQHALRLGMRDLAAIHPQFRQLLAWLGRQERAGLVWLW